jgi:LPXTG-motif cell wall-anchored protein
MKMKHLPKKATALVLSLVFILTAFSALPMTASAATETIDITIIDYPRGGGTDTWGHSALNFMNGWRLPVSRMFSAKAASNKGMQVAYCVQPNVPLNNGDQSPEILPETFLDTYENGALTSAEIQRLLGRIMQYGYTGTVSTTLSDDVMAEMIATQLLVWETIVGERASDFSHITPSAGLNSITQTVKEEHPLRSAIFENYNRIASSVQTHSKIPSFMKGSLTAAVTHELTWDGSKYSVTLTDTNCVLASYNFTSTTTGVNFDKQGNNLIISTTTPPAGTIEITANKTGSSRRAVTYWCSNKIVVKGEVQGLIMSGQEVSDPINAYVKAKVSTGTLAIIKTTKNNDGKVGGFQFRVTKQDGTNVGTFTSADDGRISIPNLAAGWYKVEEINLSDDFVKPTPNPVDVEVKGGQTATVTFDNVKKLGIITVQKTNSNPVMGNYSLAGAEFTVKNANGTVVDTIVTGTDGKGQSKALPLGTYTVKETKAPWGFVVDKNTYTRTLTGSLGTAAVVYAPDVTVPEKPQVGQVKITKQDAETAAIAQGDATLSGAVFDLLDKDGKQVERLYCGNNVSVTTKEIPLGSYTVKEVVPPKGYTLSQKDYPVKIDYAGQEAPVNLISTDVKNTVIKGRIQLVKHSDDPDPNVDPANPQVEEPLAGIVFQVYLKSAGSYENAKPTERDLLTTDENGYAISKDLPYGVYVVKEVKGAIEHKMCEPFDAFISENNRTYYYIVNNPAYWGKVKIVKVDAETGKIIPQPNVEFKVKNTDTGKWVTQDILYPTPITIDSYLTNGEGWLVMPQELHYGNYELWEVQAPYGYTLSETPIPFKITSENPADYLEVKMPNKPAMGKVTVEKTGEVLVGADKITGKGFNQYIPKYEVRGLTGATFDVIARTDIITPDGTVRATAGTVVDTITTGSDGLATSKLLYLGDYYAVERVAPFGMVLNTTEYDFSLVYENQTAPIVFSQVGVYNDRQKAQVNLSKYCEMPDDAVEDYNPYADVLFGLFARDNILTADGKIAIPADELLEYITFDKDGNSDIKSDLPFGSYYVTELQTAKGYVFDDTEYDFAFEYAGQDTAVVSIDVNDGEPVINELQRGSLKVIKTFEGKETPVAGVPFTITGVTTVGTVVKINAVTDKNGEILLENLLVGNYTVKELESDLTIGYVLSAEENAVVAADEIAEMTINNILMRGDLKIIKTFEGKTVPLAGVKFTVTGKTLVGEDYFGEYETDENGEILLEGLFVGDYTVQEIESNLTVGYVLSEEQTAVVALDKVTELQIENKLIRGNVKLIKTDKDTDKTLAGAEFELYDPDGNLIGTYTTDENGELLIENLPYGFGYKLIETKAPNGYKLGKVELTFDITENGVTVELTAENEVIPPPDNPKTGDDSNMTLWLILMGVSVAALLGLGVCSKKKKTKKDEV